MTGDFKRPVHSLKNTFKKDQHTIIENPRLGKILRHLAVQEYQEMGIESGAQKGQSLNVLKRLIGMVI